MIALAYIFQAIFFVLAVAGITGGVILVWREMRRAPDGQEDGAGWHRNGRTRP